MNTKVLVMGISAFSLSIVAAELKDDGSKDDVATQISLNKIISHGIQFLSQASLIGVLSLPDKDDKVKKTIDHFFNNDPTYAVGLGTVGMAVRSEGCPDVLFFDQQGVAFKLTYDDSNSLPLHCALSQKLTLWGNLIPHVTVLYDDGNLIQFKRKTKLGVALPLWLSRRITNITDKYHHQGEAEPSALEDNPSTIEQLITFDDGECLCYSSKKMFVISEDGQELCCSSMPDQLTITDVVSTFPTLKKIAFCTMQTPTLEIAEQPELHTWTRATKLEHWRNNRITGRWDWKKTPERPTHLDFNKKNDLIIRDAGDTVQ